MTLRDTVAKWHAAMCLIDEERLSEALKKLQEIQKPSAKILYNLGCVCMLQQRYEDAIQYFNSSIHQDKYLAIACYQRGICFLQGQRLEKARLDFLSAKSMIRSDEIDYKQLGAQVVLTKDLLEHLSAAAGDSSYLQMNSGHPLPVRDCIFQPPKAVVDNLVKHDFLGSAKIVSSTTESDIVMASANRSPTPASNPNRNHASSSMPSSPASSRHQINTSSAKQIFIPTPKRPPPRLPGRTIAGQDVYVKSQSLEDLASGDDVRGSVGEDRQINTPNAKQIFIPTPKCPPPRWPSGTTVGQDFLNNTANQNREKPPSLASKHSPKVLGTNNDYSAEKVKVPGKPFSLRPVLDKELSTSNVGQGEDRNSGQSSLSGHAARMRLLFEQGQSLEVKGQIGEREKTRFTEK